MTKLVWTNFICVLRFLQLFKFLNIALSFGKIQENVSNPDRVGLNQKEKELNPAGTQHPGGVL